MIFESDTRANFIDPKLVYSHWKSIQILREYYFIEASMKRKACPQ